MTDKQRRMIDEIEKITDYRFETSNLSAYDFIGKNWECVVAYRIMKNMSTRKSYLDNHVFSKTPMGQYVLRHGNHDYEGFDPR